MEAFNVKNFRFIKNNNKKNINQRRNKKVNSMLNDYHGILKSYLRGLLHPETAINSSDVPKAPNYVSIPTSNITFREAFDILPDKDGGFLLYWTPNFLSTQETIEKRTGELGYSYSRNWLGGFDNILNCPVFNPIPAYTPPASFKKYRLVSAGCKITYKGTQLNRAGIISHCLSYRSIPVSFFKDHDLNAGFAIPYAYLIPNYQIFGELEDVDMTTIQNGMWNGVKNVQQDKTTFVVAVPTDPSDFIFEDDGFFYAAATQNTAITPKQLTWRDGNDEQHPAYYYLQEPEDGTPLTYIFRGEGLSTTEKLYVEQYYNFEVIPTEVSAPILRPTMGLDKEVIDKAFNSITKILNQTKGTSVPDNVINQIIKDNTGAEGMAAWEQLVQQSRNQLNKVIKQLRRKEIGTNPKVELEPSTTLKDLQKPKPTQKSLINKKSYTQGLKERISNQFNIFKPSKWKEGFNKNIVQPIKWVKNNPEKVKRAVDLIEKAFLAYKGAKGGKF